MAEALARVAALPPAGMVALRADLAHPEVAAALAGQGWALPGRRRIAAGPGERQAAWMSPDELLLLMPREAAAAAAAALAAALEGHHALVAEVSDLRVLFAVEGPGAREALARLIPVDLAPQAFGVGDLRRTRLAQVAAAVFMPAPATFRVAVARSVAAYAEALLAGAVAADPAGLYPAGG